MGRRRKIKCSKCGKELFYLPTGYDMAFKVVCIDCGQNKPKKKVDGRKIPASAKFAKAKRGKREDIHPKYVFRSATEANFARILDLEKVKWKFEERVFTFTGYERKPFQYIPDFEVTKGTRRFKKGWYEVKGYMDSKSRSKLKRFRIVYPKEAANMTIVLYRSTDKRNIEFCKKLGFKTMFYDKLTEEFEPRIPTWE